MIKKLTQERDEKNEILTRTFQRENELAKRVRELEAALWRYGSHDEDCKRYAQSWRIRFGNREAACLCGFAAVLRKAEKVKNEKI